MSFEVAMKALLADADRWKTISESLTTMAGGTGALSLPASAFSFAGGDAAAAYADVTSLAHDFVADGAKQAHNGSHALEHVHAVYSGSDEAAKTALEEKWKWL